MTEPLTTAASPAAASLMGGSVEDRVDGLIRPSLTHMGFRLVRVKLMDVMGRRTLQIMAERLDGVGMNVDHCAEISRTVSALMDVHDPITEEYHLEVTSPGIDRPLITVEDFQRFIGFEAKLETAYLINGRKKYRGIVKAAAEGDITLEMDGALHTVPHAQIANAKLVLTDALIKAYQEGKINH
jgi:ribosome maturation factor RimP